MPTYSYHCQNCNHELEAFQKITDEPLTECPECHQKSLVKGIGGGQATFQFKGSGFYITDYKNQSETSPQNKCPCSKNQCEKK